MVISFSGVGLWTFGFSFGFLNVFVRAVVVFLFVGLEGVGEVVLGLQGLEVPAGEVLWQ
jgi:hypothetical protein